MTDLPPDGKHWDGPPLDAWRPWSPTEAASRLAGVDAPWCVVGGWSIDLYLGARTRPHEDLEIAVPRTHFAIVRAALGAFAVHTVVGESEVRLLADGADPPAGTHQNWVVDPAAGVWCLDIMVEPGDATTWVFRRDETVRAERSFMVSTSVDGIPFLLPHGALLYKAKHRRPKDEADLEACLTRLDDEHRAWLAEALRRAHPGHRWLDRLDPAGEGAGPEPG